MDEEEVPLTHARSSNVTQETRARFDSLLQAALKTDENDKDRKKYKKYNKGIESKKNSPLRDNSHKKVAMEHSTMGIKQYRDPSVKGIEERQYETSHSPTQTNSDCDSVSQANNKPKKKRRHKPDETNEHSHIIHCEMDPNNTMDQNEHSKQIVIMSRELQSSSNCRTKVEHLVDDTVRNGVKSIRSNSDEKCSSKDMYPNQNINSSEEPTHLIEKPVPLPRIKTGKKHSSEQINDPESEMGTPRHNAIHRKSGSDLSVTAGSPHSRNGSHKKKQLKIKEQDQSEVIALQQISEQTFDSEERPLSTKSKRSKTTKKEAVVSTSAELSYEQIIGIFIHKSDCLQADFLVQHPLVKVHLIDASTGEYLKKSSCDRSVSFYYENKEVDYILPLMTEVFDFRTRRSIVPCWEELIVFNEDVQYILKDAPSVIIMFEILDFVNTSIASSQYKRLGPEGGWHKVAWAFLKPVGANGALNMEKKVRLQLYKPHRTKTSDCDTCDVYLWWRGGEWERYPATLYVTVKGITPPVDMPPVLRSRVALQQEFTSQIVDCQDGEETKQTSDTREDLEDDQTVNSNLKLAASVLSHPTWSRLPAQSCKIPNHRNLILPTASKGCFTLKFSNLGLFLACGMAGEDVHTIILYSIPDGKEHAQFIGHQGLVYDLHWSSSDTLLLSASADCTACIWDVENKKPSSLQMLPHPSFVYCAQFYPVKSSLLATGCYDRTIRIWSRGHKTALYELMQELEGHTGFVSSLCFDRFGALISADSIGHILIWSRRSSSKSRKHFSPWQLQREVNLRELRGIVVNQLLLHPGGQRLLVHARDSLLRMVDLATGSSIQWFKGALNHRVQTSACISPCGGLVFAASEDGTVCAWNADTGEQLALYSGLHFPKGMNAVDYHPFDHMLAFSSCGTSSRIVICNYSKLANGGDVGLQLLNQPDASNIDFSLLEENGLDLKSHTSFETSKYSKNFTRSDMSLKSFQRGFNSMKTKSKIDNELISASFLSENYHTLEEDSISNPSWNNRSFLTSTQVAQPHNDTNESEPNKLRLASIIEKMDEVLSISPSKSNIQMSDCSESQKINEDLKNIVSERKKSTCSRRNSRMMCQ